MVDPTGALRNPPSPSPARASADARLAVRLAAPSAGCSPAGALRGPTPFVIAIMTFAMMIVAAAGLALSNAAGLVAQGGREPLRGADPGRRRDAAARARRGAGRRPAWSRPKPVPEAEMRQTLERWLGPAGRRRPAAGAGADHLRPRARRRSRRDRQRGSRRPRPARASSPTARRSSRCCARSGCCNGWRCRWSLLMAAATSAAVVLAARGALDTHRSTIEVMHGIGATDLQVTQLFQRKIALDSLVGSARRGGRRGAGPAAARAAAGGVRRRPDGRPAAARRRPRPARPAAARAGRAGDLGCARRGARRTCGRRL